MQIPYAILGVIFLLFLLWKGWQLWSLYHKRLRIKLEAVPPGPDSDVVVRNPELPGRARVVSRSHTMPDMPVASDVSPARVVPRKPVAAQAEPEQAPVATPILVVDVPLLNMEPEPDDGPLLFAAEPVYEPAAVREDVREERVLVVPDPVHEYEPVLETAQATAPAALAVEDVPVLLSPAESTPVAQAVEQQDLFAGEPVLAPQRRESTLAARASALYETPENLEPVNPLGNRQETQARVHEEVQDVIAVHVICRGVPFNGEDLLRCILSYGLRFGEMSIFHRHEQPTGQGRVLFSMAKAVEPGTFDLESMTGEMIPGVSFFLSLPGVNSIHGYDIMIDTAKRLAAELNGDILDLQQSPMTRQLIEHYRERVMEFERRRLMRQ